MHDIINGKLHYQISATVKTQARANDILENMFANGDICESERPIIHRTKKGYAVFEPAYIEI